MKGDSISWKQGTNSLKSLENIEILLKLMKEN